MSRRRKIVALLILPVAAFAVVSIVGSARASRGDSATPSVTPQNNINHTDDSSARQEVRPDIEDRNGQDLRHEQEVNDVQEVEHEGAQDSHDGRNSSTTTSMAPVQTNNIGANVPTPTPVNTTQNIIKGRQASTRALSIRALSANSLSVEADGVPFNLTVLPDTVIVDAVGRNIPFSSLKVGDFVILSTNVPLPNPSVFWVKDLSIR